MPTITDLEKLAAAMPLPERDYFARIFRTDTAVGATKPPRAMYEWIRRRFGQIENVLNQSVIKVTNLVTMEGALFNEIRALRPMELRDRMSIEAQLIDGALNDPFRNPWDQTPESPFGRIRGRHCITAANVAKFDGFHGIIIFDEPHPLRFNAEQVADYIDTGLFWAQKAHAVDPLACYFLFIWNCLSRAGASLQHGHAQVTLGRGMHYCKVEHQRRSALAYHQRYGSNYFQDLFAVHHALGLGLEKDEVMTIAYLTPLKEKEVLVMSDEMTPALKERVYEVLACLRDEMGVVSFNLAIYLPPIAPTDEDWSGFPIMVRVVDRGDPRVSNSDMGAMELYAQSVISSDPFRVAEVLHQHLEAR